MTLSMTRLRLLMAAAATVLLLVATLAAPLHAATVSPTSLPAEFWSNSVYELNAHVNEWAPAGSGARLTLDCGPAVTVTPPNGVCLDQSPTNPFKFTLRTSAVAADTACVYTLHQGDAPFFDALPAEYTDPMVRPVRAQRTLTVSPASTAQAPIVVGRNGVVSLSLAPSQDLTRQHEISIRCNNLAMASSISVQMAANPRAATFNMGDVVGFVACSFVNTQPDQHEIDAASAGWAFFQIVEPMQLATTGMPLATSIVAYDLPDAFPAATPYTISVAPPSTPQAFDLALTCRSSDGGASFGGSLTFTSETTAAQTLTINTPAAPAANSGVIVSCTWASTSDVIVLKTVLPPPPFSFYLGSDVVVSASAATTQLNATTATSVITVSVPAETVIPTNLFVRGQCSAGSLSNSLALLMNSQLSVKITYTAAPTAAASTPQCTFTVRQDAGSEYRRVKAAIAPITFNVAAAVIKQKQTVKGLPTAADTIAVAHVPGIISQATATAGVTITLSAPTGMAADSSVIRVLACTAERAEFGAVATVTPAQQTFTSQSTGPAAFVVSVTAPTEPNAKSTLVRCSWSVGGGSTQSEVDRIAAPQDFTFMIGTPVQLVAVAFSNSYPFDYVPASARVDFTLQTAGNEAAMVGGAFQMRVSCTPCAGAGVHTGEGYMSSSVWYISDTPFPQENPTQPQFRAWSTGVVTCHWTMVEDDEWSRAFLPPVATVFNIVPRARLPVSGVPTAADVIPLTWGTNIYPGFRRPGEQLTISMPAVPADFDFGPTWVNISLRCENMAERSYLELPNGGRFDYSATSRGAQSVVITMPNVTDDRPTQVDCTFEWQGLAPLEVVDDWNFGYPAFRLVVANAYSTLTMVEPSTSPVIGGSSLNVWFEPSQTIHMPSTRLAIQVMCTFSAPLPYGEYLMALSIGSVSGVHQPVRNSDRSEFLFMTQSPTATITANATDPNQRLGYRIVAPKVPVTVICTFSMAMSNAQEEGYADRFIRLAPTQPLVITVLSPLNISVTGVPTAPLADTPAEQTITVQPILRAAADFPAGATVVMRLNCDGLTLRGNELTFTGTGESATVAAQSITFTPPNATAGSGNVWQCSWAQSGTAGDRFSVPAPFKVSVGSPVTWRMELEKPQQPIYPGYSRVNKGILTPSGCLPPQGYLYAECGGGTSLVFDNSGWSGVGFTDDYGTMQTSFPFWIMAAGPGTAECTFSIDADSGAGVLPPGPFSFTVLPRSTFVVTGQPAADQPVIIAGGASHTFTIAPSVAPGTGGVTVRLQCQDSRAMAKPSRLYFPAGLVAAQTVVLRVPESASIRTTCNWHLMDVTNDCGQVGFNCDSSSYDRNHYQEPAPFQLSTGQRVQKDITVGGLDAQGNVANADVCADATFTIAPTVAPAAGTSVVLQVHCYNFNIVPNHFTFTAESPQAQTVIIKTAGIVLTSECWVHEEQEEYAERRLRVSFGTAPTITAAVPTFVPRGANVPIEIRSSAAVPFGDYRVRFMPSCTYGWAASATLNDVSIPYGGNSASVIYRATDDAPPPSHDDDFVKDSHTAQPMSVEPAAEDSEAAQSQVKESRRKERHAQRQRAARVAAAAIAIGVADTPAGGDDSTGDRTVTCTWNLYNSARQRFIMAPTSSFIVGTPVNLTAVAAGGAAETAVTQGASVALTVSPSAAVTVDVEVNVACPTGITPSPATFTLMAGAATGQLVTFAATADSQLGAAQCTLTSSGPGRMAVTTASPIALNVVEPSSGGASSSSSTGKGPCVDAECAAFSAASLPGLAAIVAMMLAALAQRH